MKRTKTFISALTALLTLSTGVAPQPAHAAGLTSAFAKVSVDHLQPGRTYKASKFFQAIVVVNVSDDPRTLTMELLRPKPGDLDPGYEPIPDVTWAALEKDRFNVEAWGEAVSDLYLTIPNDKKYLGKKYQLEVWTKAHGGGNIAVGLIHKLLFTVAAEVDPAAGKEPEKALPFKLEPFEYFAKNVKFNRPIDLYEQSGTALVLKNPNSVDCKYRIEELPYDRAPVQRTNDYEPVPEMGWLNLGDREFTVKAKSELRIPLKITLPRNPKYRNKNYLLLIRATALSSTAPFSVISRLYITTSERLLD